MTTGSRMKSRTLDNKSRQIELTQKGNEEVLERSEDTRRSSVQIRPAPPKSNKFRANALLKTGMELAFSCSSESALGARVLGTVIRLS